MGFCNLTAPAPKQQINAVRANNYTPYFEKELSWVFHLYCPLYIALMIGPWRASITCITMI